MFEEFLNKLFLNRQEIIENNIQKEYHNRIKKINVKDNEEKNNIKMGIIGELYYKQGVKDGIKLILENFQNKNFN